MKIGVLIDAKTTKCALTPEIVGKLTEMGHEVMVPKNIGQEAFISDNAFIEAGAEVTNEKSILSDSDLLLSPGAIPYSDALKESATLIGQFQPFNYPDRSDELAKKKLTVHSLDMIPRTTLAQSMDVLSSMASIAGYKAVLMAASRLPKYFPMLSTAAGTIAPAKVLIIGAGVAGLQAIATAKRLGAVVEAFDTRTAVKEEVMSLGAKFVEVEGAKDDATAGGYAVEQTEEYKQKQQALIAERISKSDVVITTAQLRGKPAPKLISEEMVKSMGAGSIIVDMAASTGGNCALTEDEKTIEVHGVTIMGYSNLEDQAPMHASQLFAKNLLNFMNLFVTKEGIAFDWDNPIIKGACMVQEGQVNQNN